jgi:hypothetical protein
MPATAELERRALDKKRRRKATRYAKRARPKIAPAGIVAVTEVRRLLYANAPSIF